jgi:hypothetical protein
LFGRPPSPRELTLAANRILERAVANVAVQRTDAQPDGMGDASDVRLAFAGEQSIKNLSGERRKFMADSLDAAKAMAAAGKSSEEIRALTGWFPGRYDGKLRYEIPDNNASFASTDVYNEKTTQAYGGQAFNRITVASMVDRVKSGKVVKLSEVFQHDELFAAYPEAANISFFPIAGNVAQGSHRVIDGKDVITATITIAADGSISAASTSTILHELQHFIQQREGFAVGGSPDNLVTASDLTDAAKFGDGMRGIQKYEAEIAGLVRVLEEERAKKSFMGFGGPNQKTIQNLEDSIVRVQESVNSIWTYQKKNLNIDKDSTRASLLSAINRVDSKLGGAWVLTKRNEGLDMLYRLLSGEIEARDVQARQNLTPEQLRATAPYSSENIAKEDAIVMFGSGGPQASMSMPSPESVRHSELKAKFNAGTITPEEQAEADRLVKDKARAAGYNVGPVYHGTPTGGFTTFDKKFQGRTGGISRGGFSFTTYKEGASTYARSLSDESVALDEALRIANTSLTEVEDQEGLEAFFIGKGYDGIPEYSWEAIEDSQEFAYFLLDISKELPLDAAAAFQKAADLIINGYKSNPEVKEVFLKIGEDPLTFTATPKTIGKAVFGLDVRKTKTKSAVVNLGGGEQVFYVAEPNQIKSADTFNDVDLDDRFDVKKDDIRYSMTPQSPESVRHSELEGKYISGTITPEETEEAKGLVKAAAKAAGYLFQAYHGTPLKKIINIFNTLGGAGKTYDAGAFFSSSPEVARTYAGAGGKIYSVFLRLQSPVEIEGKNTSWRDLSEAVISGTDLKVSKIFGNNSFTDGIGRSLKPGGFETAVIRNINDIGPKKISGKQALPPSDIYIIKNPEQIKSAEPFTGVPLDQRFNPEKSDIRYSMTPAQQQVDQEYMAAVDSGNMTVAQRLVNAAAKAANYVVGVVWHGTPSGGFTVFDTYGSRYGLMGSGAYFTESKTIAESYANKDKRKRAPGSKLVYGVHLKILNPMDMDGPADPKWVEILESYGDDTVPTTNEEGYRALEENLIQDYVSSTEGADIAQSTLIDMGYDGITHMGGGRVNDKGERHRVWIAFDPNQIKSADPVVKDNAGKIILPSERFQETSDDIRYSMTPVDDSDVLGYTTQVFGEKMSVAEVESIKEIYESIRKTLFDYTQPVTDASLQEFYLLYNSIRPTESGKADISYLKAFGTETAYPGAVLGALFAFADKIPDGGQAQREIIELIERSRIFPKQSFSDFWTSDSSTGTATEGGRALGARSYIVNYLNKLRGVLSHRALRIEAASKETNLPAADIKVIDTVSNGQADETKVEEELKKKKTRGGKSVIDAVAGAARPEGENDPRNKPENSPATDPKTASELAAKRLIGKYNTKKTKKIEKKQADVVTVLFKEHLSLRGGQSAAELKQKLIDAGLSPAIAAELTATAENELNRLLQAERDKDSKPMKGAAALLPSNKSARAIVDKLAVSQSDTWSWPNPANKDPVVALVARYYRGIMPVEQLNLELEKLKVEKGLRAVLVNAVSAELSKKQSVAKAKEADVEKDALAIINKLSQTQSDTLSWPIEKPTLPIVELVTRFYDANGSMSAQALDAELIKLGLPTRSRIILVNSVSAELSKRQAVKAAREKLIAENKPTKSAESFAANWQKTQDAPKDAKDTEQDPVRSILNQLTKVGRGQFHFDLSPDGKALFFDIVYKRLLSLNVSEKAAMAATSAAYQKYLTNRANQIAALRKAVAEKGLSRALAREMMNITATNQRDPEYAKKFIKQVLLDAGIPEDIADASLPLLLPSFQKALADTREQLLRDFIDGRPKGAKRIPKPVVDEFLKAVRLGATNPDYEPSTPFAKANKWRNFTRAEHDEMARLDEIAMDPMQTRQEQQIALAGIAKIISSKVTEYDRLVVAAEIYRNSALSNLLTTGGIQVWTPVFSSAARVLTDGVVGLVKDGNFNRFIASVESFMRAASPTALKSELFSAFGQNITTFNKAYEIDNQARINELSNLYTILQNSIKTWKTTKNPVAKAKALIGITYGSMDYVRRAYASLDNVSQSVFYRQIMDLGMRDIILKANGTEADFRNMISNRTRNHEQIVTELISQGQSPSRAWVNASEISRRQMAGEIVDIYGEDVGAQVEAQDVISRKEAARELGVASDKELDGHVIPMLIETIKALAKASDNRMAGSGNLTSLILFGFPVTALKVMNRSLDYSPVGYARLKMSERETKKYANDSEYKTKYPSFKTDNQKQQRMAESMVGTIGLIALLAMVMGERDKEPEDRIFMVHNAGPRDRAARQIWRAAGNEPQSVQFRFGTNSPWLGVSWAKAGLEVFAPIFAVAGATFDSTDPTIRREDAYDQVMVFASQSLASMSRPLSSIQDTAGVLSGKEMSLSSRSLANQIGFRASSFLPWSSLTRNYNKWQGARDTTNALSAFAAMIPIVGPSLTEPALNSLGDPIGKTPNEYSYKLGTAIPVSFGLRREDTPLYEFLLSKGKFPTAISRPTQEKKYGKMSDETWRKYIEVRGQNLKSLILKRKDSLQKLDAEKYDDAIENLTGIANDRARATLKMRPAPK